MVERLVVVGGDAAAMSAASQARRRRGPEDLAIVVFEQGEHVSYSACGIPYLVGGVVASPDQLIARSIATFRDNMSIDVRTRHRVESVDIARQRVQVCDIENATSREEGYDQLLIATGAVPVRPAHPGLNAAGVHGVQTLDDGLGLLRHLEQTGAGRAVVVGGGYIGLEMAEALLRRGLQVRLIDAAASVMPSFDPDMGALIATGMRETGIAVHCGEGLVGVDTRAGRVTAVLTEHDTYPADVVVLGLGVRPSTALAAQAGIQLGPTAAIAVDRQMRTRSQGVWAAGDCAEKFHRVSRAPAAIALGTYANKEGRVAGINLGGGYATFPGVLGTAVSKICSLEVGRTGLTHAEATAAGFESVSVHVDSTTRASYYPGAQPIRTKLVVERGSGRLLGGQVIGREGTAKRIDTLATALWAEMAVDEIPHLDLSYAPPFSPLWDPVLIAARKASDAVEGQASA